MSNLISKDWLGFFLNIFWPKISLIFSFYRTKVKKNKLPSITGKEVIIVGTSPNVDINKLSNLKDSIFSIGLHRVHMFFHKTKWRPDLLFVGDELLLQKQGKEILTSQDKKTRTIVGSRFFVPFINNKLSYISLKDYDKVSIVPTNLHLDLDQQQYFYFSNNPALNLEETHMYRTI